MTVSAGGGKGRGRLKPRLKGLRPQNPPARVSQSISPTGAWCSAIWEPAKAGFADALAHPLGAASAASSYIRRATMKDESASTIPPKSSTSATTRRISPVVGPDDGETCAVSGVPELFAGIVGEAVAVAALSVGWPSPIEKVCVGDGIVPPLAVPPAPAGFGPPNCGDCAEFGALVL